MSNHYFLDFQYLSRLFWFISFILVLFIVWSRIRYKLVDDWSHEISVYKTTKRPVIIALAKLYTTLKSANPQKAVIHLRNEMAQIMSIAYNKPMTYFVRHKDNPKIIRQYLPDDELFTFYMRPNLWLDKNKPKVAGIIEMLRGNSQKSDNFNKKLLNVMTRFENEVLYNRQTDEMIHQKQSSINKEVKL